MSEINEICFICYNSYPNEDFLHLTCAHSYCKACFFNLWQSQITSGFLDISALKCPQEKCLKPISLEFLKGNLPNEQYLKLEDLGNKNYEILNPNEKAIKCPKCEIRFSIWRNAEYFNCASCKTRYCSHCYGEMEKHKGFTCQEYEENKNLSSEEQDFFKSMREKGFKKCPVCFCFVEREGGCNFIRCESLKCNKKTSFCYLCGMLLDAQDHYSHYEFSPWEGPCKNQKEIKEIVKDDDDKNDEEKDLISCPGCEIRDGKICKIEKGVVENDRFCNCSSEKCKGKMYCLLCRKGVTDKNFDDHVKGDCKKEGICLIF